jgi:hypothetical protein
MSSIKAAQHHHPPKSPQSLHVINQATQHHHPPKSPQASMDKIHHELGHHEQGLQHVDSKIITNGKSSNTSATSH